MVMIIIVRLVRAEEHLYLTTGAMAKLSPSRCKSMSLAGLWTHGVEFESCRLSCSSGSNCLTCCIWVWFNRFALQDNNTCNERPAV